MCVFVTRRKWKAWQARKQTKGAVTTTPSQGFSVPANVENTTSVVYTPDPISQNTPAIQPSTTSSSNHTPTPHRVAPPPPVHTNLATSTNSPGAQVTMSASDHITRVQQQQQPTSRQHNLSPTPHRYDNIDIQIKLLLLIHPISDTLVSLKPLVAFINLITTDIIIYQLHLLHLLMNAPSPSHLILPTAVTVLLDHKMFHPITCKLLQHTM